MSTLPVSIASQRTSIDRAIKRLPSTAQKLRPSEREFEERHLRAVSETLAWVETRADRIRSLKEQGLL